MNDLYLELHAMKIQLEERERTLCKRERQLNNGSKVHYKKKKQLKPFVTAVTGGRHGAMGNGRRSLSMTAAGARYDDARVKCLFQVLKSVFTCGEATQINGWL